MSLAKIIVYVVQKLHMFGYSNTAFIFSFTHYYCTIFYSLDAGYFQNHEGVKQFVRPDLGPNCLQRLSADNKISG